VRPIRHLTQRPRLDAAVAAVLFAVLGFTAVAVFQAEPAAANTSDATPGGVCTVKQAHDGKTTQIHGITYKCVQHKGEPCPTWTRVPRCECPSPSPTRSHPRPSPSVTHTSPTPTHSATPSASPSVTPSQTPSQTPSATPSETPSETPTQPAPTTPPAATPTPGEASLPVTGPDASWSVTVGVVLFLVGLGLLVATRRRRTTG
jgi:LPXTG-motif cell wall-anchored protein